MAMNRAPSSWRTRAGTAKENFIELRAGLLTLPVSAAIIADFPPDNFLPLPRHLSP